MKPTQLEPIPPGEILWEEFMEPLGISQNRLSRDIDVPVTRIHHIIHGKRSITADTALRLALYFDTTPELWLNLQSDYDLRLIRHTHGTDITSRVRRFVPTADKNV